jgi:hypothetical protein
MKTPLQMQYHRIPYFHNKGDMIRSFYPLHHLPEVDLLFGKWTDGILEGTLSHG